MFESGHILKGKYQLQQRLGRTATGRQTWLALDIDSEEQVTVKLLAFNPQMRWEELKLFEREAQILQELNHPRIPHYRDYFSLDQETGFGVPWFGLVQDYIPGSSLQDLLEQGKRFSETQVRKIAVEILEILVYLHQLIPPVLHRDIKPSNLILGTDERVYLVDFGSVQAQAAVTGVTFTVVGTGGYAPLEQFWGRAVAASDLYALGATLIHLLTGIPPADLPQKDSRIQFRDRVSIEDYFVSWIEQSTEIALEKRFSSAAQALEDLEAEKVRPINERGNRLMRKIAKPPSSFLELKKTAKQLSVYIPPHMMRKGKKLKLGYLRLLVSLSFFIVAISLTGGLFIAAPLLGLTIILVFMAIALKYAYEYTQFELNQNNFKIRKHLFGVTYGHQEGVTDDILGVFLHLQQRSSWEDVQLIIRSRHKKTYRLGGALTEEECAWLAQEIQDWLYLR